MLKSIWDHLRPHVICHSAAYWGTALLKYMLLLLLISPSFAVQPTVDDLIVIANDGPNYFGPDYIKATKPWYSRTGDSWFHDSLKWPHLDIHLPGGHNITPMPFLQFTRMRNFAALYPDDADAQARADFTAFTQGLLLRHKAGLWTMGYMGGFDTIPEEYIAGKTATGVKNLIIRELKPLIDGKVDAICFDMEKGPGEVGKPLTEWTEREKLFYGEGGVVHMLMNYFKKQGILFMIEPAPFADYPRFDNVATLIQDVYFISREYPKLEQRAAIAWVKDPSRAPEKRAGKGMSGWADGTHAKHPIRPPDPTKALVIRKIDTLGETRPRMQLHVDMSRDRDHVPGVVMAHAGFVK